MKRCVITYAEGNWYPEGQKRLLQTLRQYGGNPDVISFTSPPPGAGSPQSMTAKPAAARVAVERGYDSIIWCDSSIFAIRDIGPVFEAVESQGVGVFGDDGWNAGQWASDLALEIMGISRDDAMRMPWVCGAILGVSLDHPTGREWYNDWISLADAGAFGIDHPKGPHAPAADISSDPRVKGYRRDGPVLAYLRDKYGLQPNLNRTCTYWKKEVSPDIALVARGGTAWPWERWIRSVV